MAVAAMVAANTQHLQAPMVPNMAPVWRIRTVAERIVMVRSWSMSGQSRIDLRDPCRTHDGRSRERGLLVVACIDGCDAA